MAPEQSFMVLNGSCFPCLFFFPTWPLKSLGVLEVVTSFLQTLTPGKISTIPPNTFGDLSILVHIKCPAQCSTYSKCLICVYSVQPPHCSPVSSPPSDLTFMSSGSAFSASISDPEAHSPDSKLIQMKTDP